MKKINILFILSSLHYGGAERQVVDLINGLSVNLFNIFFLTFEKELGLLPMLDKDRIQFSNWPRKYKFDFSSTKKVADIIRKENITVLHCTNQISLLIGILGIIRARKKIKLVFAIHTSQTRSFKHEMFDRFLYTPLMTFCHIIITVCENQRRLWSRKYPWLADKFVTIYNGIDMERFKDTFTIFDKERLKKALMIKRNEFVITMLAAFRPEKGHEYAIRALKILLDLNRKIKLILIGDGERKEYLQRLAKTLSVEKNVLWLGYQKDPRKFLSISDIVLVPSFETFSIAMLEAFAMGKPIIAADLGGSPEMLIDGVNGFLVKHKDIYSIVSKVNTLIFDPEYKKCLSQNARNSVQNKFTVSQMINKTTRLFKTIEEI